MFKEVEDPPVFGSRCTGTQSRGDTTRGNALLHVYAYITFPCTTMYIQDSNKRQGTTFHVM